MSIIIKLINFIESKIEFLKFCSYGTTIFNILDNTTELWMTKYIIGGFFSTGGATLYNNPSDQTVLSDESIFLVLLENMQKIVIFKKNTSNNSHFH